MSPRPSLKRISTTVYLDPEHVDGLKKLADITRIPQAIFIREAIDDLLKKYAKELRKASRT